MVLKVHLFSHAPNGANGAVAQMISSRCDGSIYKACASADRHNPSMLKTCASARQTRLVWKTGGSEGATLCPRGAVDN